MSDKLMFNKGTPVLTGKAAEAFVHYLENAKPDLEKQRELKEAIKFHSTVKIID